MNVKARKGNNVGSVHYSFEIKLKTNENWTKKQFQKENWNMQISKVISCNTKLEKNINVKQMDNDG